MTGNLKRNWILGTLMCSSFQLIAAASADPEAKLRAPMPGTSKIVAPLPAPASTAATAADDAAAKAAPEAKIGAPATPNIGGLSAPGADAMMTPDLLLIKPTDGAKQAAEPLKAYVNAGLTLQVDQRNIAFEHLSGVQITVNNLTGRPLMVDGTKATITTGGATLTAIPVTVLQKAVLPKTGLEHAMASIGTNIVPAAFTIGAVPAVKDEFKFRKPVLQRYGPDEQRREVESSRFGRRIIWPGQKTQGILYFQTEESLTASHIQIPAATLFDTQDACVLSSTP
ncbi:MAG: hypothetical protein P4L53_26040 [Candidatus Obscuribacterales bacterium]|nr:hypothetical protein [Candidatus Obscuribacterales bacterium]